MFHTEILGKKYNRRFQEIFLCDSLIQLTLLDKMNVKYIGKCVFIEAVLIFPLYSKL